jgi:alpha-glucoside transport system permease protein
VTLASTLGDSISKFGMVIAAVAIFLAAVFVLFFLASQASGRLSRWLAIGVFLGPAVALLVIGLLYPAIRTLWLSFHGESGTNWIGWGNYKWIFTTDRILNEVLLNTVLWIIIAPVVVTVMGLSLALVVDRLRGEAVYKSLIFLPMAVSFVGASIIWKFIYEYKEPGQPQIGLLNQTVMALGWHHPPNWILSKPLNTFLLMVILIWVQTGFAMVVLSAAIKAIPADIVEAAAMDGARGWKLLVRVKIPLIRSTLIVVLTTVMITTLKIFDIVRTMTGGNFGTQVLANEMYSQSFEQYNTGRGSALAVILFLGVLPLVAYNIMQLRRERANR